jgi:O-antigen/teichoic acid export membrane protein
MSDTNISPGHGNASVIPSTGFKFSLIASFAGTGWAALAQLICIPLYIKLMGIESYGLVAFYLMLQAVLQVLDFGLSPTINREMARYSVQLDKMDEARDLVRTLEIGYWLTGLLIGGGLLAASGRMSVHWLRADSLANQKVTHALMLMAVLSVFQWPVSFYQGGLMGLHRQVLYNIIRIVAVTLNTGGAVLILWLVSPTITALLAWQVVVSFFQALVLMLVLWKSLLPATRAPRFAPVMVRNIWRFAAGMSGIAVFSLILGQADKLILSRLFSLKVFAYYTLAGMFGTGLVMIANSVFNATYPRFCAMVALTDEQALSSFYHMITQVMALLIVPLAAVCALFSREILRLWTGNNELANNAAPIATVLVIGSALSALMFLPYMLQLAYGWTSIGLKITVVLTGLAIPAIWFAAKNYGPVRVAFVWLAMQAANVLIGVPLTHRRLLRHDGLLWVLQDVGPSILAAILVTGVGRSLMTGPLSPVTTSATLLLVLLCAFITSASVAPSIRRRLLMKLSSMLNYA